MSITQSNFSKANWDAFGVGKVVVVENFEGLGNALAAGVVGAEYVGGLPTAVGTFSRHGGTDGSGGTVTDTAGKSFDNTGTGVALRSGDVYGRTDTTKTTQPDLPNSKWFFDSNDLSHVKWNVSIGGGLFDQLVFSLTDPADQGAVFSICTVAGPCTDFTLQSQQISTKRLITVDFGMDVSEATIFFSNTKSNDGWGLDDVAVSAVPLPAPALMLLGGLGALGAMRARKKRATA